MSAIENIDTERGIPIVPNINEVTTTKANEEFLDTTSTLFDEPLVDVADFGVMSCNYYYMHNNPPYNRRLEGSISNVLLRESVAKKVAEVNSYLSSKYQLKLKLLDGYRPNSVQKSIWDFFYNDIKKNNPELDDKNVNEITSRFASLPLKDNEINNIYCPLHMTGASVDLVLVDDNFQELSFGSLFDEVSDKSRTSYYEEITSTDEDVILYRKNRRILYNTMINFGFTNYPHEWWHFDMGNKMYALCKNRQKEHASKKILAYYGTACRRFD